MVFLERQKNTFNFAQKKTNLYRKFNVLFLTSTLLPLVLVGIFNIIIDPFGIFATPVFPKINQLKPQQVNKARLYKPYEIKRIQPKIVLLGSSRIEEGLNINNSAFTATAYNLGLPAANTYEVKQFLRHAVIHQPHLEQVVLGLDFFMFNQNLPNRDSFEEKRLGKNWLLQDIINASLSFDALQASQKTLMTNIKPPIKQVDRMGKFKFWLGGYLNNEELYNNYQFKQQSLKDIQDIVELCRQYNIDLKIFISPVHATQQEAIRVSGLWSEYENWKRQLVKIAPVWDFSGYNSVTTEAISNQMVNYIDSSHYSEATGNLILDRLFSNSLENQDFGQLIDQENVESHLDQIEHDRAIWQKNNPQLVELVESLKK